RQPEPAASPGQSQQIPPLRRRARSPGPIADATTFARSSPLESRVVARSQTSWGQPNLNNRCRHRCHGDDDLRGTPLRATTAVNIHIAPAFPGTRVSTANINEDVTI